jgi:hypothetical protein
MVPHRMRAGQQRSRIEWLDSTARTGGLSGVSGCTLMDGRALDHHSPPV